MARMARQAPIGMKIRRAMERKRMNQDQLADALGVSRSAVNAWINDRSLPQRSIGALEELLGVDLTGGEAHADGHQPAYDDPDEALIWSWDALPPQRRREMIADLRAARAAGASKTA